MLSVFQQHKSCSLQQYQTRGSDIAFDLTPAMTSLILAASSPPVSTVLKKKKRKEGKTPNYNAMDAAFKEPKPWQIPVIVR